MPKGRSCVQCINVENLFFNLTNYQFKKKELKMNSNLKVQKGLIAYFWGGWNIIF